MRNAYVDKTTTVTITGSRQTTSLSDDVSVAMSTASPTSTTVDRLGILDSYPGVDRHSCQLLGPTALVCFVFLIDPYGI